MRQTVTSNVSAAAYHPVAESRPCVTIMHPTRSPMYRHTRHDSGFAFVSIPEQHAGWPGMSTWMIVILSVNWRTSTDWCAARQRDARADVPWSSANPPKPAVIKAVGGRRARLNPALRATGAGSIARTCTAEGSPWPSG